ncbi:hypothetical protein EJ06DRAFT_559871 [Trichodelitschia bisporula]|uniref:P-loop containing nucleoside triphosphate hydrolase protein n=1 Tax=Trichodelitschia bisporula TaxID=703511 RepID=A0A6G1HJP7_9PEZI|nr:hypothetical protein EJ06DRAFT_559871 [Trichodelitschia bisporula]
MTSPESQKPVFVATHPRACSTAFERVFMTCHDTIKCVHEPFGDAYYFGPERLSARYEKDEKTRIESGFSGSTYNAIFEAIEKQGEEGKRLFIKDMAHYWVPPASKPVSIAPSLLSYTGVTETPKLNTPPYPYSTTAESGNPTVVPSALLSKFHFAFLIRHPRSSIPSYYRCTVPPLAEVTGFHNFDPEEAGYKELRAVFDYLRSIEQVGPRVAGQANNGETNGMGDGGVEICVIDADDMLDNPYAMIEQFCRATGLNYSPEMLTWDNEDDHRRAKEAFEKWRGFHDDAIASKELKPRTHKKAPKSDEQLYEEWTAKFGKEGADIMAQTVKENVEHYEYLKQFAVKL